MTQRALPKLLGGRTKALPDINPSRTLAVVLGASVFPDAPTLADGRAFYISADDVRRYLRGGLEVPDQRILWLFDDSRSPSDQLRAIGDFLERSTRQTEGDTPENLLIYYVGHGLFGTRDQAYSLAIRYTTARDEGSTSIRAGDLAGTIRSSASFLRRYLIFDCCFAGAINKEFQSGALHAARARIASEFPARGTALLCSSNATDASLAPEGLERTMFSFALIEALKIGHPALGERFTFSELGDLVKETLRQKFPDNWVRPEVHSPDQREGDIADLALFPNPAWRRREANHKTAPQPMEPAPPAAAPAARRPAQQRSKSAIAGTGESIVPVQEKAPPEAVKRGSARRPASPSPPAVANEQHEEPAAPRTPVQTPVTQPQVVSSSSFSFLEFKEYRASLSWFRRTLLLYKPPSKRAWLPRVFFYQFGLAIPYGVATRAFAGPEVLVTISICWILHAVSVRMEKPR